MSWCINPNNCQDFHCYLCKRDPKSKDDEIEKGHDADTTATDREWTCQISRKSFVLCYLYQ